MLVKKMAWPWSNLSKKTILIYFYILLFLSSIIIVQRFDHSVTDITLPTNNKSHYLSTSTNNDLPNTTTKVLPLKLTKQNSTHTLIKTTPYPPICSLTNTKQTCPTHNNLTTLEEIDVEPQEWCPSYFRWIHEDLKPWKIKGITKEMVEAGKSLAYFRLIILDGKVYVETYKKAFQTRDVFTIWGILQVVRLYPGKLPDLELMFECDDNPVIKKSDYYNNGNEVEDGNGDDPPPMFHYCGDDDHFDIPFPDWSFWGWHELNIKPWDLQLEEIKEGNQKVKWANRKPYAYYKGNLNRGSRKNLLKCNSSRGKSEIYEQIWPQEVKGGFKQSNLADQCNYRYKIYMEGKTWSVSEKYIQACDSMLLLVQPRYYEFYTRSLLPLKHYWPINPAKLCESIKFAVNWGNKNPFKAQEIAKGGNQFIMEELKMKYVYDYMFHLLNEYGKLMKYKPTIPEGAVEVCSETMACNALGKEKQWKLNSLVKAPSQTGPCTLPMAYDPHHLHKFLSTKDEILRDVEGLARVGG